MTDWKDEVTELVFNVAFMNLATSDADGVPWASPVEFACDEELRFYWFSATDARHSENIRANPRAAMSIYDCRYVPLEGPAQGLYGEGSVEELGAGALADLMPSLGRWISWRDAGRATPRPARSSRRDEESPGRYYRLTPIQLYALHPDRHPEHGPDFERRVPVDIAVSFARAYRSRLE